MASRTSRNVRAHYMARSNISACARCKRKKKRCDKQLPRCSLCQLAGAECVSYDAVTDRDIPRSYVHNLEERMAYLENKLHQHGLQECDLEAMSTPIETTRANRISEYQPSEPTPDIRSWMAPSIDLAPAEQIEIDDVLDLTRRNSVSEPSLSRILLTELMRSRTAPRFTTRRQFNLISGDKQLSIDMVADLDDSPISLPTKEGAQALVKAYFQYANQSLPLLHEPTLRLKMDFLYTIPRTIDLAETHTSFESRMAIFFVFEVFAVAILTLQKQDPSRMPTSIADRYHKTALKAIDVVGLPSDLEGVQAILLVAQYSYHHPTACAVWKTVGAALRLAVELGLHQDPPEGKVDFLMADTMRRTFWVAYAMDRNTSIALGLPLCLPDGVITTEFPSQENDAFITPEGITNHDETVPKPKRVSLHVFKYRRIQSEMQTMLHQRQPAVCGTVDFDSWQRSMHERIQKWYDDTPRRESLTDRERKNLENFELTYHRALFYLYHPSPSIPSPSEPALIALTAAATSMIRLYRRFFTEHRLTIFWQAVENLFSAGTALMHSFVSSAVVRDHISVQELESLVHTCSSVLWGMVEHFPDLKDKRDAFDIVVCKTFADLNQPTNSASLGQLDTPCISLGSSAAEPNNNPMNAQSPITILRNSEYRISQETDPPTQSTLQTTIPLPSAGAQDQYPATLPPTSSGGVGAFSFADFDDMAFDWEAFEGADDFMSYNAVP